ncbi:MAG: cysteine desulfurase [bacterium]|nr:cysteine desulfurase [bacterium]
MKKPIYLDYNGTTPIDPELFPVMKKFIEEEFGNPSSSHWFGIEPKKALLKAREQAASMLGCSPGEIYFTSGGTESNNMALKGIALKYQDKGKHIITSIVEHPSVLEVCNYLETIGFDISYLPVDRYGQVSIPVLKETIRDDTILISIMHANNEVGTIQPIKEISAIAKDNDIILHTDAAQSVGKIPVSVNALGVDLLSLAGQKFYAPKGIGALYIRNSLIPEKLIHGAGQEAGLRAGTENIPFIAAMGKACEIIELGLNDHMIHMKHMTGLLHEGIQKHIKHFKLNGHPEERLPNTLSISFYEHDAGDILSDIGPELAVSAGAACHSNRVKLSHVLEAMEVPADCSLGTLRLSTGRFTTELDIFKAISIITKAVVK